MEKIAQKIKRHLQENKPLAMTRFGDGEYKVMIEHSLKNSCYINHLGHVPSNELQKEIRSNILETVQKSDIVGLPEHGHAIWKDTNEYFSQFVKSWQTKTSLDFHKFLLESGYIYDFIQMADTIVMINGHFLREEMQKRYPKKFIYHLKIPLQDRFFGNNDNKNIAKINYYPDVYNNVLEILQSINVRDYRVLVLIGGGFVGKRFTIEAKKLGMIALDMGHVFDVWAGYGTRGSDKFKELNKYKF